MNHILYAKDDNYSKDDSMEKYIEINLRKHIPADARINLDDNFRKAIFEKIRSLQLKKDIIKKLDVCRQTFEFWEKGTCSPKLSALFSMAKILHISDEDIFGNIVSFKWRYKMGSIYPRTLDLPLNPEVAEWFGLLAGDGCITDKYTHFGNISFDLIFFFTYIIQKYFGIMKKQIEITINVPFGKEVAEAKPIELLFKRKGFSHIITRKIDNGINFLLVIRVCNKILSRILDSIVKNLECNIKISPSDVKAGYIAGFSAAEGCISQYHKSRVISISQKYPEKLILIKELMHELGLKDISGPNRVKYGFEIRIRKKEELKRYNEKIGFGHYKRKNEKLLKVISGYTDMEFKSSDERYKQIFHLLESNKHVTSSFVAENLNIDKMHASHILTNMRRIKLLNISNFSKPYKYSKVDKNDYKTASNI